MHQSNHRYDLTISRVCVCRHPDLLATEICYNLLEVTQYVDNSHSEGTVSGDHVILHQLNQPIYFRYDLSTGKSVFLIEDSNDMAGDKTTSINRFASSTTDIHPFAIHLSLLEAAARGRSSQIERIFKSVLPVEESLLFDNSIGMSGPHVIKKELQSLHNFHRWIIIHDFYNSRNMAAASNLVRELDRLIRITKGNKGYLQIDSFEHERIRDGFYCFQDFCNDRARALRNRQQRVQNLINLVSFLARVTNLPTKFHRARKLPLHET